MVSKHVRRKLCVSGSDDELFSATYMLHIWKIKMNHDVTHCANYDRKTCPASCYYAKLEEDLKKRSDLYYLPVSYSFFIKTSPCWLFTPTEKRKHN